MLTEDYDHQYWLFDWLDKRRIINRTGLQAALDSRSALEEMRESALTWKPVTPAIGSECNLVAGSGLGLYNGLTCTNPPCRVNQVDVLFRHAWHYFDFIYLPDAVGDLLRDSDGDLQNAALVELSRQIETAIYLRDLGAESLTRYYSSDTVKITSSTFLNTAESDGIWQELGETFLSHPERYTIRRSGRERYSINYEDPELRFSPGLTMNMRKIPKSQRGPILRSLLAQNMVQRHQRSFTADLSAAQQLGGSLGSTIWSHEWVTSKMPSGGGEGGVFFRMEFPSLNNVPVADLIALRVEHKDSFLACRTALVKTVRELSSSPNAIRSNLADEVVRDLVIPETARLSQKLEAAKRVLAKKSAVALTVAGVSTWCGVHLGMGVAASMGAGAVAALASGLKDAAFKYAEERRDIEISDMSFIWKALKCVDR